MEIKRINLHIDQKRALLIMLSFSMMLILIGLFVVLSVGKDLSKLSSLMRSEYEYSASINDDSFQDNYLQFDAGICFSTSIDSPTSMNAEILMQANNSHYTRLVDWNANKLGTDAIAVTSGLVRSYGLKIGDTLYSKHIVDGNVNAYRLEQILPDISYVTEQNGRNSTDGVIIMGYDDRYANSLKHSNIFFTKIPIEELTSSQSIMPLNIVYRTQEIATVTQKIIPYLLIYFFMSVLITYGLVGASYREVKYNTKRMVILGFEKNLIDVSFRYLIYRMGFPVIIVAFILSIVAEIILGFSLAAGVYSLFLLCTESITVLAAIFAFRRRFWR